MKKKDCKSLPVGVCARARARNVCDAAAKPKMMGAKTAPSTATGEDEVCSNVKQECCENYGSHPPRNVDGESGKCYCTRATY